MLKKQRAPDSYTNGNIQATAIKRVFRTKQCFKEKVGRESGKLRVREAWNKGSNGFVLLWEDTEIVLVCSVAQI